MKKYTDDHLSFLNKNNNPISCNIPMFSRSYEITIRYYEKNLILFFFLTSIHNVLTEFWFSKRNCTSAFNMLIDEKHIPE